MQKCGRCGAPKAQAFFMDAGKSKKQCTPCRESGRARFKKHYAANSQHVIQRVKRWKRENPEWMRARRASDKQIRRAQQMQAMPKWLTVSDKKEIQRIYTLAARLRREGQDVHVDHHYPLRGRDVCGLHVPGNLEIKSAAFNVKKGNRRETKSRNEPLQVIDSCTTMRTMEITDVMLAVIERYVDRKITRERAAALLKLSDRQVTRIVAELGLERVDSTRAIGEAQVAKRRLAKHSAATEAALGNITIVQAAARAGCHPRTIQRYVDRLKAKKKS